MIIAIASDHAGFEQKQQLVESLRAEGNVVHDLGPDTDERVDYPDYASKVAQEVQEATADRGILLCGTGVGMAIAANRFKGIRAVNALSPEFAELARQHNNANILCLSARFSHEAENEAITKIFLTTNFEAGRHTERVKKLDNF